MPSILTITVFASFLPETCVRGGYALRGVGKRVRNDQVLDMAGVEKFTKLRQLHKTSSRARKELRLRGHLLGSVIEIYSRHAVLAVTGVTDGNCCALLCREEGVFDAGGKRRRVPGFGCGGETPPRQPPGRRRYKGTLAL
jgi:hypothetical protein